MDAPPVQQAPAVSSTTDTVASTGHPVYAGFWLRFVAWIIDTIIVTIPCSIVGGILGFIYGLVMIQINPGAKIGLTDQDGNINLSFVLLELCSITISITATWLYFALLESGSAQSTFGKRLLGLKVTDLHDNRIGFGRASGRFFGKIVSGIILYIGYIMAGFTERKQALHDILADTLVVRK